MNETWQNKLYFGDNLDIMRGHMPDESVDLIYLYPPYHNEELAYPCYSRKVTSM